MSAETLQILLLEDNQSHVELIRRALMPEGKKFNLAIAGTLANARKILKKASPGLMIANHYLPDGKGIELLPGDPGKLTFPIAILTGHGNEQVATAAMKAGAIDYIVKSAKTLADMPHIIDRIMRVWQHITERRQAEKKLAKSEMKYRALVNSVPALPWSYDIEKDLFTCVGEQITDMLGIRPEAMSNMEEWAGLIHPDDREYAVNYCIKETKKGRPHETEYRMKSADGGWIWIRDNISVTMGENGPVNLSGFMLDITERKLAQDALEKGRQQLREGLIGTVVAISKSVGARDPYTAGHQLRVARLASCIAQEMGLDRQRIDGLRMGASMHDIGKIYLPAEILVKPSQLSDIEFELVKTHSQVGYDILKDIPSPWPMADIAQKHHEHIDGTGYPQGLKGNKICLEARIVAVADVVETMSAHRPYRPALGIDAGLKEIETHRGQWFEPDAVDACLKLFREKEFSFD